MARNKFGFPYVEKKSNTRYRFNKWREKHRAEHSALCKAYARKHYFSCERRQAYLINREKFLIEDRYRYLDSKVEKIKGFEFEERQLELDFS